MLSKASIRNRLKPLSPIQTGMEPAGKLIRPVKGILFDIYGTLFISDSGDINLAQNKSPQIKPLKDLLKKYQIQRPVSEILNAFFDAIKTSHTRRRKTGVDFPEIDITRIWAQILKIDDDDKIDSFAIEFELIVNPVYPMPHLKQLLNCCKDHKLLMGIISNAQFFTPLMFEWFLDSTPEALGFHPLLTLYSFQFGYAKPSTYLFKEASKRLARLNHSIDSILYVGNDILNDIYPAQKVGFKTVLFAGDKRSLRMRKEDARCRNVSPDLVITDLLQLTDCLRQDG